MDISQFESLLAKAKAHDELTAEYQALKVKFAEQADILQGITKLLIQGGQYPEAPMPVPFEPEQPEESRFAFAQDTQEDSEPESPTPSFDPTPSLDGEDWKEVPRKKLPKKKHISGNKHGTDFTHNPCITEDQAILAGEQGIRFPKMILRNGGKAHPNEKPPEGYIHHYGLGKYVERYSPDNPRWKCCLCVHHFEGFCSRKDCLYAHSQDELRPFVKYGYNGR